MSSELERRGRMIDVLIALVPDVPLVGPDSAAAILQRAHPSWLIKVDGDTVEVEEIRLVYGGERLLYARSFGHQ
jgi:hypothetical protein